jgi:hypothetical protein
MKTTKIAIVALCLTLGFTHCKKKTSDPTPEPTPEVVITEDDAADIIASSTGSGSYGMSSSTSDASQRTYVASNSLVPCLYSLDTTFTKTNPTNSLGITYSYSLNYKYQMYCTSNILTNMVFQLSTSGNLELPKVSASSNSTGTLTLTGILPSSISYTANGNYVRNGSATSKVRNKNSYTYQLNFNLSNLSISKTTYAVQSGSGTITFVATTTTGKVYNFTGTLTYVNAATATLVINGKTYTVNIPTSDIL